MPDPEPRVRFTPVTPATVPMRLLYTGDILLQGDTATGRVRLRTEGPDAENSWGESTRWMEPKELELTLVALLATLRHQTGR